MGIFDRRPNVEKMKAKRDVKGLIEALRYKDEYVRKDAAIALGKIGDERAIDPLIQALKDKHYVRREAARALGVIGGERVVGPLIQALRHEDGTVRMYAASALGKIRDERAIDPLIQALKDNINDRYDRKNFSEPLRIIGKPAIGPLIEALKDEDDRFLRETLGKMGELALEPLIRALKDEDWRVREGVAEALGETGDERALIPLVQILEDMDSSVRYTVAFALDKLGWKPSNDKEKVHYLIARKKWSQLEEAGEPAVEPLIRALKDRHVDVRKSIAEALGMMGDQRAVEPLIEALKDENEGVREVAALALGMMGDQRAVEPLIEALKDGCADVRGNAAEALGRLGDVRAAESLTQTLENGYRYVRENAALALGMMGDQRAVEPLIEAMKEVHSDFEVIRVLGKLGDLRAAEPIISWLFMSTDPLYAIQDPQRLNSLIEGIRNLFGDYTALILKASRYVEIRKEVTWEGHKYDAGIVHHNVRENDEAIRELCRIPTKISSNILRKVLQKKDIEIKVGWSCMFEDYGILSFENQREMAKKELEQRENPPYDPSAYLEKGAWKI